MTLKKIAIVFEYHTLSGGERSMLAVIDWLRDHRPDFDFVAIGPSEGPLAEALQSRKIPLFKWFLRDERTGDRFSFEQIQSSLIETLSAADASLVHANSLSMGRVLGRIAKELNVPTTSHIRDIIKLSQAAIVDLQCHQRLIAVSKATRDFHLGQGLSEQLLTVIRNGIDLQQFRPRCHTGWLAKELGIGAPLHESRQESVESFQDGLLSGSVNRHPTEVRLVACIGQIGLRKGLDVLADAALPMVRSIPGLHFLFIGERTSQKFETLEFERAIRDRFASAGLSERLHWLGKREDIAEILGEIDLLVHPARQEPFGRVLLEASAAVPIVATNVGGTAEIIENGVTGLLVPAGDASMLAEAAVFVLRSPDLGRSLGLAARERVERAFPIAVAAQALAKVWSDVLQ